MIGVFDSGHGGLTILQALEQHLPQETFLYLGDHRAAPYGDRSAAQVHDLTRQGIDRLFAEGCRLVILACNTASAKALRQLQQNWLPKRAADRRVLGVMVPAIEAITRQPWQLASPSQRPPETPRSLGIFATQRTVESGAYPREIGLRVPSVTVYQQACPGLVDRIEAGAAAEELRPLVQDFVARLQHQCEDGPPELVLLGCTHYPLVAHLFEEALPPGTEVLDQPQVVARSLAAYLTRHPRFASKDLRQETRHLTTGEPDRVSDKAARVLGQIRRFEAADKGAGLKHSA